MDKAVAPTRLCAACLKLELESNEADGHDEHECAEEVCVVTTVLLAVFVANYPNGCAAN